MKKPTGCGTLSLEVQEAREIQKLIDARGGLRSLDDHFNSDEDVSGDPDVECKVKADDMHTPISISSDHDEEVQIIPKIEPSADIKALRTVKTVRADPSKARPSTSDLLKTIASNFDTNAQLAHERDRSQQNVLNLQVLTLSQQLRDALATIETLRREAASLQDRLNKSERHCNREKMRYGILEMKYNLQLEQDTQMKHAMKMPPRKRSRKYEQVWRYADGGESRCWVSSDDDEDPHAQHWLNVPSPQGQHTARDDNPSVSQYSFSPANANIGHSAGEAALGDSTSTSV